MVVLEKLQEICSRDNAIIVVPEENKDSIPRRSSISCKCSCGSFFDKKVSNILISGLYCRECTGKRKQERFQQTCLERYGTMFPTQCPEIVAKRKPLDNIKEINEKRIQTNIERFGSPYAIQSKEILEKREQTIQEKYNTDNVLKDPEVKRKVVQTYISKYGVENPNKNPEVIEKRKRTLAIKRIERFKTSVAWMQQEIERLTALYNLNQTSIISQETTP